MANIKDQQFENAEQLFSEIEDALKEFNIDIQSKADHDFHFIIEIASDNRKIGRLKVHYNKWFKCTSTQIIQLEAHEYYEIILSIFPFKKRDIQNHDPYMEYLYHNHHLKMSKIHETEHNVSYEINRNNKEVWVKIIKSPDLQCQYLKGDFDLFDYVQYIVEDEMSRFLKLETINL